MVAASEGRLDQADFYRALYDATLILPQPHSQETGPTTEWSIAVFQGVCPAYTSLGQFAKALPDGMVYAEVPVPTIVRYWDVQRPLALNFLADLSLRIPGPVVVGLPTPRVGFYDTAAPPDLAPPSQPLPPAFLGALRAFAGRHPEVRCIYLAAIGHPNGSAQALLGLAVTPATATGTVAAALADEVDDSDAVSAVAHPFAAEDPDELAQRLVAVGEAVWP